MWGSIAVAALSAASSYAGAKQQNAQLGAIQGENERQNAQAWRAMGQRINTVNLQRGLLRQQTGTDLFNINREASRAASAGLNTAAAAGVEGATVDELALDTTRQAQESRAQTIQNENLQEVNMDTQIDDIINSAVSSQRYSVAQQSEGQMIGSALVQGGLSFAQTYAGSYFNYGATSGSGGSTALSTNTGVSSQQLGGYNISNDFSNFNSSYRGIYGG